MRDNVQLMSVCLSVCRSVSLQWPLKDLVSRNGCLNRQESFLVSLKDSRAAADLEKVNKEKEKLQAQVEALKKAAHVSRHFTHTVRFSGFINVFNRRATVFYRWAKLLELNFFLRRTFH